MKITFEGAGGIMFWPVMFIFASMFTAAVWPGDKYNKGLAPDENS